MKVYNEQSDKLLTEELEKLLVSFREKRDFKVKITDFGEFRSPFFREFYLPLAAFLAALALAFSSAAFFLASAAASSLERSSAIF